MEFYIATDGDGKVVSRWERAREPSVPGEYTVEQVDSLPAVDYWADWTGIE